MMMMVDSFGHGLEISASGMSGTCNFKVKLFLQVIVKLLCLQLTSGNIQATCNDGEETDPQAPDCLDDCTGRRFFLDRDGICKMCVQCQPGYQHDKECGNGENGDAVCIPCPEDHYSYNLYDCVACRVCENTQITQGCSPSTDRQCGECLPGFYKDPQNPDFCNQRCESHSNPDTIPSCKAWLANQQGTTLSAVTSQMSSFPDIIDEGTGVTGRGSLTLIIIILLVLVLIGGSVIPVYICCKHCRHGGSKLRDIETCIEHLEPGDIHPEPHSNSDGTRVNGDVGACDVIEIVRAMSGEGSEVVNDLPLSTVREQVDSGRSILENEGEDKDPDKTVLDIFESTNEINSPNDISSVSNSQMDRDSGNGNSCNPHFSVEGRNACSKVVHGVLENESSSYMYNPSFNSPGGKSGKPLLEISEDHTPGMSSGPKTLRSPQEDDVIGQDNIELSTMGLDSKGFQIVEDGAGDNEEDGGKDEPDECQTLLPGASLRIPETTVIKQDDNDMLTGIDSEGAHIHVSEGGAGDDEEDGDQPHECQTLLLGDHDGGAESGGDGEWRSSAEAEAEITQPSIRKEKEGPSRTKSVQPHKHCLKMKSQPNITLNIENVQTLVVGDQYQYHYNNSAECPPQGSNEDSNEKDED